MRIETLHQHFLDSNGICTDTRKITKGCLFFALKGDNFNGNKFTDEALEKGAYKVVIDDMRFHRNTGETILHGDSLSLLQQLATYHRKWLGIPIVSLTGSNGKTTTKELISAVLSKKFNTIATKGNLNNHIGVPLTLLSMAKDTEMGIVEMGANHQKEIENLCNIAFPDYGYITNFGKAHLEGFGGVEGVVKGKSELYQHLQKHGKKVFVNGNDSKQLSLTKQMDRIVFGRTEDSVMPVLIEENDLGLKLKVDDTEIQSRLVGRYNFGNISAAIAIGNYFEVPLKAIKDAIEEYVPSNNRSQLMEKCGHTILLDAYNANPTSMLAALENVFSKQRNNLVLLLGDMFELGRDAEVEHQAITDFLKNKTEAKIFLVGEDFYKTSSDASHIEKFRSFEDVKQVFPKSLPNHSFILIKGSRGMALERILEFI
ncbi:UDP-N-acetylmuramoyl-tripeptide--D-alanyl-D-alanine ligase [Luteirhabdus pelagi]|uniref:UDP-N-acetylmuramoyl-tripeptide--D-alanyl-D- alanine ligase n=1 Tax=Luteirhabdus pelagi TaxID=2792783 RepID=UPI00193A53FA|nr:UDP-N-acetylmuramoyl-tripeptide--D-alanyl-D-alanine ligase [Luteirhabdus pelagi]